MYQMYVVTDNNNIVILNGDRESFRLRQRNINSDGSKIPSFKFVSYRSMQRESKKNKVITRGIKYDTKAKL